MANQAPVFNPTNTTRDTGHRTSCDAPPDSERNCGQPRAAILPMKGSQILVEGFDESRGVLLKDIQDLHRRVLLGQIAHNVEVRPT